MHSRRQFIKGSLAVLAAAGLAGGALADDAPLIIRPVIDGVPRRFSELSLDGQFVAKSSPTVFAGDGVRFVFFIPNRISEGRLVIFSHGALADPVTYKNLLWHYATHGYIVGAPLHDDAILESGPTLRKNKVGQISEWPVAALLEDPAVWKSRVDLCVQCLEIASEIAETSGFKLNTERTVIAGHGYGSYIAQLLMGAKVKNHQGEELSFRDNRFFSGVCLSPQGPGIMGLNEASWSEISSPMLFVQAQYDDDFTGQPAKVKEQAFALCKPGYKHLALVKNSGSTLFTTDDATTAVSDVTPFLIVKGLTTCFMDAYAGYDQTAFGEMSTSFFERATLGAVLEYRR